MKRFMDILIVVGCMVFIWLFAFAIIRPDRSEVYWNAGYAEAFVPREEHSACQKWAFGDSRPVDLKEWPARWNKQHPDLFTIYGTDEIISSMRKVGQAYMNRNYVDENGTVVIGRDNTLIVSGKFQLDDGTTLSEVWPDPNENQ